ncbi:helix-turn-helix domain-containing protein [Campylobacter concisus]|uniref:helix-turn-helix domain-containing protein n=1 Tax=Campylobacter concisus TaxID=199 RepID=UPI000D3DA411|nr:helix-turn-helix domain-containing protein [Campylobacter concisus]
MTRQELAEKLNITRNTLTNWEKEKPELIRLINQGLALDDQILETQKFLEKLEKIKEKAKNGKLNIKEKNK